MLEVLFVVVFSRFPHGKIPWCHGKNCWRFPATASPTFWISGAEADLSRLKAERLIQWVKYLTSGRRLVYDIVSDIGIGHFF